MSMMKRLGPLLLAAIFLAPVLARAEPFEHPHDGLMPAPLMMILRQAKLTPDQQNRVHQIMTADFEKSRPLIQQLHKIHEQIADKLLSPGPVTAADLASLEQQESRVHQQLDQQTLASALQIRALLTRDQLNHIADLHTKLKALRDQIHQLMGEDGSVVVYSGF